MCPSSRSDRRPGLFTILAHEVRTLHPCFGVRVRPALVSETLGSRGSRVDQRISEAMGCCSMDTLVSGCCCCNAAIVLPPKIGCRGDIMVCCADVTCCFDLCSYAIRVPAAAADRRASAMPPYANSSAPSSALTSRDLARATVTLQSYALPCHFAPSTRGGHAARRVRAS